MKWGMERDREEGVREVGEGGEGERVGSGQEDRAGVGTGRRSGGRVVGWAGCGEGCGEASQVTEVEPVSTASILCLRLGGLL
jgi:hypothetical protein